MLRTVYLHGAFGDQFGREPIELVADSPVLLVKGLDCVRPGFFNALRNTQEVAIIKKSGDTVEAVQPDTIGFTFGDAEEIHVAGSAEGSIITEAMIVSWGIAAAGTTAATVAAFVATVLINVAISVAIGAIASSLAKPPSTSDGSERPENKPSDLYNGAVNVVEQGYPVPLVYGQHRVGSVVISAGVNVERVAV